MSTLLIPNFKMDLKKKKRKMTLFSQNKLVYNPLDIILIHSQKPIHHRLTVRPPSITRHCHRTNFDVTIRQQVMSDRNPACTILISHKTLSYGDFKACMFCHTDDDDDDHSL